MSNVVELQVHRPRWQASILYRTDEGPLEVVHYFEEVEDLHGLIERGPHWDTIISCTLKLARHAEGPKLTVESAARL